MRRELLLLGEVIDAARQAHHLCADVTLAELDDDRRRRESLPEQCFRGSGQGERVAPMPLRRSARLQVVPTSRLFADDQ